MKAKTYLIISIALLIILNADIIKAQVNLDSGLVAYYPFNGNVNDESGNGYDGTVFGSEITTDKFGNQNSAHLFDGINDYISTSSNVENNFDISDNISIAAWVRLDNANDLLQAAVSKAELAGYEIGYYGNTNKKYFINFYIGGAYRTCLSQNIAVESQWVHLVGIYEHTLGSSGIVKFYVNGALEDENNIGVDVGIANSNVPLVIGANPNNSNPAINKFWDGALDDVRIYNRVLDENEITSIYNEGLCYETITVTDTLIINANITGYNPVTFNNTIKVYPNPASDHIFIDVDNNSMGYEIKIINTLSQIVFQSTLSQSQYNIDINTWTGNGTYFVQFYNIDGNLIDVKKIIIQ